MTEPSSPKPQESFSTSDKCSTPLPAFRREGVLFSLDIRKLQLDLEKVAVAAYLHFSTLKLRKTAGNTESKAAALASAGRIATNKALGKFLAAEIQLLAGGVFEAYHNFSSNFLRGEINAGAAKGILADVVHKVIHNPP